MEIVVNTLILVNVKQILKDIFVINQFASEKFFSWINFTNFFLWNWFHEKNTSGEGYSKYYTNEFSS